MTFPWSDGSDIALVPAGWEGTYAEWEASLEETSDDNEVELTADQVTQLLRGDYTPLGLTAGLWNKKDHPRDAEGKFTDSGSFTPSGKRLAWGDRNGMGYKHGEVIGVSKDGSRRIRFQQKPFGFRDERKTSDGWVQEGETFDRVALMDRLEGPEKKTWFTPAENDPIDVSGLDDPATAVAPTTSNVIGDDDDIGVPRLPNLTTQDYNNVVSYQLYSDTVNSGLRNGDSSDEESQAITETLHNVLAQSTTTAPITVSRGIGDPRKIFGSAWSDDGDNTGLTWRDNAFTSTTEDIETAEYFANERAAQSGASPTLMRISIPVGTSAVRLDTEEYGHQLEVLIADGTSFRVTGDSFSGGVRVLDVTIEQDGLSAAGMKSTSKSKSKKKQKMSQDEWDARFVDHGPPVIVVSSESLTADGSEHTGAMIALLPTIADQERLAVPGGEDEEELHLTLFYLGEAAKITPEVQEIIIRMMQSLAKKTPIIDGDGFAVSMFNPEKPDKETCVVLGVSGAELARVHKHVVSDLADGIDMVEWPPQHAPWIPHVTLAYSNDSSLPAQLTNRTGPIRFDVLRVVFAEQATDFPLYDGSANTVEEVSPVIDTTLIAASGKESDVNKKGGSHNLRDYWVHGAGAAKIGWGTDGSFARCVAQLGKHVKNPQGLCAEYHKAATGEWPAEKGVESSVEIAVTADAAADDSEYDGGWIGPLVVEDTDTGDGRMFSGGALTWGDTETQIHPFQWAPANNGEHKGSVTAGRINRIWRDTANPRVIMGQGVFNLNDPDGLRAFTQVKDGFAGGVSIDPDQIADADVELEFDTMPSNPLEAMAQKPTKTIFHAGRIRGATLVAFPALIEASIRLTKKSESQAIVASASTTRWQPVQHEMRLGEEIDGLTASVVFAFVHELDDVVDRKQCRFLHHEINDDGTAGLPNLVACTNHIGAINSGRTFGLKPQELHDAYQHMAQHFTDAGRVPPAFSLSSPESVTAAIPAAPPLEWFGDPKLSGPTPITVTDDGRVFGHAAAWNSCHTGFADTCVSPPFENDYGYFTTGEVLTAEGHRVAVGQITMGTPHASTRGLSVAKAIDHYGDTGTAVADVSAGVDDHGIWVAGAVRPSATADQLHALRASALSGDWRRIGGNLRMVALLAVNVPGFPIPRVSAAVNSGKQVSLVASGIVEHDGDNSFAAEIALLAGSCGIPLGKKHKKYETMDEELTALVSEIKGD